MSGVDFDSGFTVLPNSTLGHIAGEGIGIVTLDNVPGRAVVDLIRRSDNAWLRRTISADDGTYRFTGLPFDVPYNLIGRDMTDTWDDVIVGRVLAFAPVSLAGNAPACVIGMPYLFAYTVAGGEAPYSFTLTGDLPDGLALVTTDTTLEISGTPTALAANQTFEIEVEDVRAATVTVMDTIGVFAAGSHRYWRVNISAANNHCSVAELEMADVASGANLCVGGFAIAGDYYPSGSGRTFAPAQAFDGSFDDIVNSWAALNSTGGWIGYLFTDPVVIAEVRICPRGEGGQSPRDFTIESSDDGIAWTVEATYAGLTSWSFYTFTAFAV